MITSKAHVTQGEHGGWYVSIRSRWTQDNGNRTVGLVGPMDRQQARAIVRGLNEVLDAGQRAVRQWIDRGVSGKSRGA